MTQFVSVLIVYILQNFSIYDIIENGLQNACWKYDKNSACNYIIVTIIKNWLDSCV